ncbi:MAG: hypothetical protein AAF740_14305 [Bacteroidota bacterium]
MELQRTLTKQEVKYISRAAGFKTLEETDLSSRILPFTADLQARGKRFFFSKKPRHRLMRKLPDVIARNAMTALLAHPLTETGIFAYLQHTYQKPSR